MAYDIPDGETEEIHQSGEVGETLLLRVTGSNVSLGKRENYANDDSNPEIAAGDRAKVAVPPGTRVFAANTGTVSATVTIAPMGTNGLSDNTPLQVDYAPRSELSLTGSVAADVTSDAARELGKVRLEDPSGTLMGNASNPVGVAVESGTVSATTPNQPAVHTASINGDGSFPAQSVPDGHEVVYYWVSASGSGTVTVNGTFPVTDAGNGATISLAVNDVSVPSFSSTDWGTLYAIAEVSA